MAAGSVDDNASFDAFLAYLDRVEGLGIAGRPFDPSGRVLVHVVGNDGRPVDGATIDAAAAGATDGEATSTALQTDASGTARYLPAADAGGAFRVTVGGRRRRWGGDTPEALDEALAAALGEPAWRDPATTVQLMFLLADAPPHVDRQVPTPYTQSIADAAARGITIHAIGASNTDDQAEVVFRQLAQATGGRFVFLAYGNGATATGPSTDIDAVDYEELPPGDLVVRLVSETLATLTGGEVDAPPTTTVPPTNPPGQD